MTDDTKPCTVGVAVDILADIARHHDAGRLVPDIDAKVARLQTLSDSDLTVLSTSRDTFALNESNRRLSVALRQ